MSAALGHQTERLHPVQGQVQELIGAVSDKDPVTKVGQHAVVKARVIEFQCQRVLDVDPASHCFGHLPVGQVEQELQDADQR